LKHIRIILLGAPGVGKGTQAERLQKSFKCAHISTGDMLRESVREGTQLGEKAKSCMEKGELVPDALILDMVAERLGREDCENGFILDGFPRTVIQAEKLDDILKELELELDAVLSIDVSNDEIVNRLSKRFICTDCGKIVTVQSESDTSCPYCRGDIQRRKDDEPDTVRHRLTVYDSQTKPLIQYYENTGLLKMVDGIGSADEVYGRLIACLGVTQENE